MYILCNSYPRSGKQWTHLRTKLFIAKYLDIIPKEEEDKYLKYITTPSFQQTINTYIRFNHLGYNGTASPAREHPDSRHLFDEAPPIVFFLLRDARAVLSSAYYHASGITWKHNPPMDINQYVSGEYGVYKYCQFLNTIHNMYLGKKQCRFIHYEDAFDKKWVRKNIPALCGIPNYKMSDQILDFVYYYSSLQGKADVFHNGDVNKIKKKNQTAEGIRFGTIDSYKTQISQQAQDKIVDYLDKHCKLIQYRKKYL